MDACFTYPESNSNSMLLAPQAPPSLLLQNILIPPTYAAKTTNTVNYTLSPIYNSSVSIEDLKGIVTADGTGMLIGYAHGCSRTSNYTPGSGVGNSVLAEANQSLLGGGSNNEDTSAANEDITMQDTTVMPISRDERACVVAMIDVNTGKKPNKIDKDVFYYQSTSISFKKENILQQGGQSIL